MPYTNKAVLLLLTISQSLSISVHNIPATKTPPNRRHDSALAFDPIQNSLFIYGGFEDSNEFFDDMWRFDLNTQTWEEILSPSSLTPGPRSNSYMQVLSNRRFIMLFGGSTVQGPISDLWLFDLNNYLWHQVSTPDSILPSSVYSSKAAFEANGKEYLAIYGGIYRDENSNRLYILDLETLTWSSKDSEGRYPSHLYYSSLSYYEGYLYAYGGWDQLQEKSRDLYRYELSTGKWDIIEVIGEKPPPLFGHASFVYESYLYILLGNDMDGFDSMTKLWRISLNILHPTWEKIECKNLQPSVPRMNPSYIHHRNKLYVFGGYTYYGLRNDVLVMNLNILKSKYSKFQWEILSQDMNVPPARLGHAMVVHDEKLYIMGGKGKNRKNLSDIWTFSLKTETWEPYSILSKKPLARSSFSHVKMNDLIVVYGGESDEGLLDDMHTFNLRNNIWNEVEIKSDIKPSARKGACIAAVGNISFIFGGKTSAGYLNDLWKFDFSTGEYEKIEVNGIRPSALAYSQCKAYSNDEGSIVFYVYFGETWGLSAKSSVFKFDMSAKTWTPIRDIKYDVLSRSRAAVIMLESNIVVIGGQESGIIAHQEIYELDITTNKFELIGTTPHHILASGFTYYGNTIYIHGGGSSFNNFANNLIPTNLLTRINLGTTSKLEPSNSFPMKCSKGTYHIKFICKPCAPGSYSEIEGALECKKCPPGYFSKRIASESSMECEPCPYGAYNPYEGGTICLECPSSSICPIGSIQPQKYLESSPDSVSIQPYMLEDSQGFVYYNLMIVLYALIFMIFTATLVLVFVKRTRKCIKFIDIYTQQHNYTLNSPMYMRKNYTGGVFTAIGICLIVLLLVNSSLNYSYDNISESKALVPSLALERKYSNLSAKDIIFEYTFKNYGGQCTHLEKCTESLEIMRDNLKGTLSSPKCQKLSNDCSIQFHCYDCGLTNPGSVHLILSEDRSYATDIILNITASSSIPNQYSSFLSSTQTDPDEVLRGQDPTVFYYKFIPSLFLSETRNSEDELTGYHVSSMADPEIGSCIKTYEYDLCRIPFTKMLKVTVQLDRSQSALVTNRMPRQSEFVFFSSLAGSVLGIMGGMGVIMRLFERVSSRFEVGCKKRQVQRDLKRNCKKINYQFYKNPDAQLTQFEFSCESKYLDHEEPAEHRFNRRRRKIVPALYLFSSTSAIN